MGGTSTDVCLLAGWPRGARGGARGRRLPDPAADGRRPHGRRRRRLDRAGATRAVRFASARSSAGAHPGPACYGARRRRPTVTDANLAARTASRRAAGRARARSRRRGARARRPRPGGRDRRRQRRDAARAARRLRRARPRPARASRSSRSAAPARCTPARSPRSSGSRRCSFPRRPACSRRSASSRATSGAIVSCRTCARSAGVRDLPREGEADLRYRGQSFELTVPLRADLAARVPPRARGAVRLRRRGPRDRARRRAHRRRRRRSRASRSQRWSATGSRGLACSSCRARRAGCPTAGAARRTTTARWCCGDERRAAGDRQLAARDRGGDGRGAHPVGVLREHQGAPGLLDRGVRRGRPHGRAGGAHPRSSRGDAGRGRRGDDPMPVPGRGRASSTTRTREARIFRTSRSSHEPGSGTRSRVPTTPTSAAWSRRACRRSRVSSTRRD